ncbi:RTA1-domain-containing protein [Ceratobasidium sp. AG-I]|nr:RTA1-domain-containing protein [Ceratobasidium sp. AG-I]
MSASALGFIMAVANATTPAQTDQSEELPFNYIPTGWIGITFLALFGITTAVHFLEAVLFRTWYMLPTLVMCGLGELAAGGAMAATADTPDGSKQGSNIMLAGIIVQFVAVILYTILAVEFVIRFSYNRPARKIVEEYGQKHTGWATAPRGMILMLVGLGIATLFMVIRSVYRTIELTDGWNGVIISTEKWFNWFDGMPIVVAMVAFNVFHPGYLLRNVETHPPLPMRRSEEIQLRPV